MKKWLRWVGICLLGVILSFVLLSIFVEIDLRFSDANVGAYARSVETVWWFDWVYNFVIVLTVSLTVSLLARCKYCVRLSLIAISPFLIFYIAASSFSIVGFVFLGFYLLISVFVSSVIRRFMEREEGMEP